MAGLWKPGDPVDLSKLRSVGKLREGYKSSTRRWVHDGDFTGSFQTDHWDGRLDATIRPKAVRMMRGREEQPPEGGVQISPRAMRALSGVQGKRRG